MQKSKSLTISLPRGEIEKIRKYAYKTGRKISTLIRISLEKFIQEESGAKNE